MPEYIIRVKTESVIEVSEFGSLTEEVLDLVAEFTGPADNISVKIEYA